MAALARLAVIGLLAACGDSPPATTGGSGSATGGSGSATGSTPIATADSAAAVAILRKAIDERYSYRDRLGLDWPALFDQAKLERATTREELIGGLRTLLANARDPHLALVVDGTPTLTDPTKVFLNIASDQVKLRVSDWKHGHCISIGKVDGYAYVLINGLEKGRCDGLVRDWAGAYATLSEAPGLILDLRGNGGGNEAFAQQIAGYFVDKPLPYVRAEVRDLRAPGGFQPPVTRVLQPATGVTRYSKPVVVLSGQFIMSSAESFLLMMRVAGATIIGARSRGSSGNPQQIELGHGIAVRVPSWKATLIDGTPLEGVGVVPDIEVPVTADELAHGDKIIDAAVAELAKRR